jgi:hypothetical protein
MVLARGAANIADQLFGWHPRGWGGGFLAYLHSPWGYDEPEILRYSNSEFGRLGADAVHRSDQVKPVLAYNCADETPFLDCKCRNSQNSPKSCFLFQKHTP